MNIKEKITEYLQAKYDPQAIILHGSRVRGEAGENSDWDIFLLTEEDKDIAPEKFEGESLDTQAVILPVEESEILDTFGTQLIETEVLHDSNDVAAELIEKAKYIYEDGPQFSDQEIENRKNYLLRYLYRIKDHNEDEGVFFWYVSIFYEKAVQYWFEVKKNRWSEPIYAALDIIKSDDTAYSSLLEVLYDSDASVDEKIKASENIFVYLFPHADSEIDKINL